MKLKMLKVTLGGLLAITCIAAGCGNETDGVSASESELRKGQLADGGSCYCPTKHDAAEDGGAEASHGKQTDHGGGASQEHGPTMDADGGVSHGKADTKEASDDCTCKDHASDATHGKSDEHTHAKGDAGPHKKIGGGGMTHGKSADHEHDAGTHGQSGDHHTK